jgi:hypothetical protein
MRYKRLILVIQKHNVSNSQTSMAYDGPIKNERGFVKMENKNIESQNEQFHYTYSVKQQEEVKRIRQRYSPCEEDKMEQLRKLDADATKPGTIVAIIVGVVGMLLLGLGMSCVLVWTHLFVLGIVVGVIGFAGMALALLVFNVMTKKQREKITPEIMRLTDELMEQK